LVHPARIPNLTLGAYYAKHGLVPKVLFVNEHREVEVEAGRKISAVADDLGIAVKRTAGIGFMPDYTIWVRGEAGSTSPMTWFERWVKRCKGWRRMANKTRILGDIEVWTQQGIGYRLNQPRPVNKAARAGEDGSERFDHENNAAGTAWNPYGHPKAVGQGEREAPKYVPKKKKTVTKKAAPAKAVASKPVDASKPVASKPGDASKPDTDKNADE
jgi:hypothetical protein